MHDQNVVKSRESSHRVIFASIGGILVVAATLKGYEVTTGPTLGNGWLINRFVQATFTEGEWLLGLSLVLYIFPRIVWRFSVTVFSVFAIVSAYKVFSGESSCGCFGRATLSPWWTLGLDVTVLVALTYVHVSSDKSTFIRRRLTGIERAIIITAFIIAVIGGWMMLTYFPTHLSNTTLAPKDGSKLIVLEPEEWVGKVFPLIPYIEGGEKFRAGKWIVLLFHTNCSTCKKALPLYERMAKQAMQEHQAVQFAFAEIPPRDSATKNPVQSVGLRCVLNEAYTWFATTPIVIELTDGEVISEFEGDAALKNILLKGDRVETE